MSLSTPIRPGLSPVGDVPIEARFDAGPMSSVPDFWYGARSSAGWAWPGAWQTA